MIKWKKKQEKVYIYIVTNIIWELKKYTLTNSYTNSKIVLVLKHYNN